MSKERLEQTIKKMLDDSCEAEPEQRRDAVAITAIEILLQDIKESRTTTEGTGTT
jgi:hypothetical protein